MNADQKKRAQIAIKKWWAADSSKSVLSTGYEISELLQELVDAPEVLTTTNPAQISSLAEPFGYFKAEPFGWTDCAETDDGAIALYTAPPAPSVPEAEPVARVTGYYAGYLSIATVDGRVLSAGTALYLAPPAPKLSDERILEIYEEAKANWNAQADQCNQWSDLGVDEVVTLVARAVEREILGGAQS